MQLLATMLSALLPSLVCSYACTVWQAELLEPRRVLVTFVIVFLLSPLAAFLHAVSLGVVFRRRTQTERVLADVLAAGVRGAHPSVTQSEQKLAPKSSDLV